MPGETFEQTARRIYYEWDMALSNDDVDALMALYAPHAHFESPAVPLTMDGNSGVCQGHDELRPVLERVAARKPPLRTYYRTGYLTDGRRTMIFEYPREAPDGEQMDFSVSRSSRMTRTTSSADLAGAVVGDVGAVASPSESGSAPPRRAWPPTAVRDSLVARAGA